MDKRIVSWFSCGAASAVATKLAIEENKRGENLLFVVAYCEVAEEHPDNKRFLEDCEKWFGQDIVILGNNDYNRSIYNVFAKTGYLKGPSGARCTGELKKAVRQKFEKPNDRQVFGYCVEENEVRVNRFIDANADVDMWPILVERGISHSDCLAIILEVGIELPEMYKLGYRNNNCIGCVKGEAGYWNKIRVDFPEVFERMSKVEESMNRTVCKREWVEDGKRKLERIPLKDLPPNLGNYSAESEIQCGIFCHMAIDDISK